MVSNVRPNYEKQKGHCGTEGFSADKRHVNRIGWHTWENGQRTKRNSIAEQLSLFGPGSQRFFQVEFLGLNAVVMNEASHVKLLSHEYYLQ